MSQSHCPTLTPPQLKIEQGNARRLRFTKSKRFKSSHKKKWLCTVQNHKARSRIEI